MRPFLPSYSIVVLTVERSPGICRIVNPGCELVTNKTRLFSGLEKTKCCLTLLKSVISNVDLLDGLEFQLDPNTVVRLLSLNFNTRL